jgi:hypothetical protein
MTTLETNHKGGASTVVYNGGYSILWERDVLEEIEFKQDNGRTVHVIVTSVLVRFHITIE